jgi:pimeloyl-ACP methyl ester carboxylesterase
MTELTKVKTGPGLMFDVQTAGATNAPMVLLLHGFAESLHMWRTLVPVLAGAGYRAVAPSQRGYSPGARPDTSEFSNYAFDHLVADALAVAAACGRADRRFHLVGHDWGGSLAWAIADRYPERLASLAILSRPHPLAFNRALEMPDGEQKRRSAHHKWFLESDAVARLLADDVRWLRERHKANGVPAAATNQHIAVIGNHAAMSGALACTARAARITSRSASPSCRRSTSGAMPTTRSVALPLKARPNLLPLPIGSKSCRAAATSRPSSSLSGLLSCCWNT